MTKSKKNGLSPKKWTKSKPLWTQSKKNGPRTKKNWVNKLILTQFSNKWMISKL